MLLIYRIFESEVIGIEGVQFKLSANEIKGLVEYEECAE
jgi:hypothetical protein